jgi:guanylate kinase
MGQRPWFDRVLVNDDLDRATEELEAILEEFPDPTQGRTHP